MNCPYNENSLNFFMFKYLRSLIPETSFLRLMYSWSKAVCAKIKYGNPSESMIVIGVTGTDGKTSTTHFTAQLLEKLGMRVAMSSTEEIWIAGEKQVNETKRTTLSPFVLQQFLLEAKQKHCQVAIIEVSSHALIQGRVFGVDFSGAIVTNISQEHGNYHKTLEEYARVKSKLFRLVKKSPKQNKILVLNKHMDFYDMFARIDPNITRTYALADEDTSITASHIAESDHGSIFSLSEDGDTCSTMLNIPGKHNIENILASALVAEFLGFSMKRIAEQMPYIQPVAGRLEEIPNDHGFKVYIDFAITPGALEKLLIFAKTTTKGNVTIVFGCTGANHDHEKRPMMGKVASELADFVVLTEDETYGEDNEKIMNEIERGFRMNFLAYKKIGDRSEAIRFALENAKKDDTVIITGMGNFNSRFNGKEEIPWSDRECVKQWINNIPPL